MKKLNQKSTQFFCSLVDRMDRQFLEIKNEPFSPLYIKHIGEALIQGKGMAVLYSLCQYTTHFDDQPMKEPEMCFAFLDDRQQKTDYNKVSVIPYRYVFWVNGTYETSIKIKECRFEQVDNEKQAGQAAYANKWLHLLQSQGY